MEQVQESSTNLGGLGTNEAASALRNISAGINNLRGGNVEAASANFAELASNRNAISTAVTKSQDKLNEIRRKNGEPQINFEQEAQKVANNITGSIATTGRRAGVNFNSGSRSGARATNSAATSNKKKVKKSAVTGQKKQSYKFLSLIHI